MAKKVLEMSEDEKKLYNELKKDVLKANQRISKLEKLNMENPFAVKILRDYLSSNTIQAITKTGKISLKSSYNLQQLLGIKRATENFLGDVSTYRDISKIKKEYEEKLGKQLNLAQINTLYQLKKSYNWIYEYIPKSEFWGDWVPLAKEIDEPTWIEQIGLRIGKIVDVELKRDLEDLYNYVTND